MAEPALSEDHLDQVLEKMYQKKGWDFRRYRKSSLKRCIERRISCTRLPSKEYIERLDSEPAELDHLFNHITIKVSEFFRDPEVFDRIERDVIPATLERLRSEGNDTLRIWSCGCARGEEPYSMAILLCKILGNARTSLRMAETDGLAYPFRHGPQPPHDRISRFNIKIFATDIDESSIEKARRGIFGPESFTHLPLSLRDRFFKPVDDGYQVIPSLRNLLTFGVHNIVSCIHLSHMDILLCRNLLIYFEKDLQEKVFEKFFYSLNHGGFIILGKSEGVPSPFRDKFREVFKKEKIYQKI